MPINLHDCLVLVKLNRPVLPLAFYVPDQEKHGPHRPVQCHCDPYSKHSPSKPFPEDKAEKDSKDPHRNDCGDHRVLYIIGSPESIGQSKGNRPDRHTAQCVVQQDLSCNGRGLRRQMICPDDHRKHGNNKQVKHDQGSVGDL